MNICKRITSLFYKFNYTKVIGYPISDAVIKLKKYYPGMCTIVYRDTDKIPSNPYRNTLYLYINTESIVTSYYIHQGTNI
jgi:hypothetical protein